ncbi:MAG: transcriptional repressor [Thermomicrobiales bacterium]|nr:transcriptional repressor [Thermomicrobiales bacterium]
MQPQITSNEALTILANHGYRATNPRRDVVELVMQQTRPFTAEQIVAQLPTTSRASTGPRGQRSAIGGRPDPPLPQSNGHPAYVVGEPGHRHHLICSNCGYVVAFTSCPVEPVVAELGQSHDFAIQGHNLEIFGLCQNCRS